MSRRPLLAALVVVQSLTLVAGSATAVSLSSDGHRQEPLVDTVQPSPSSSPHAAPVQTRTPAPHPVNLDADSPVVRRAAKVIRPVTREASSPRELMQQSVKRLPGFRAGDAVFTLVSDLGSWGLTDLASGEVYVSNRVPASRMYDVVAHEWSHALSAQDYHGDVDAALEAMNAWFGGSGLTGAERAADCMARLAGASWTNYTSCKNTRWQSGARRLLSRQPL